jgi:hypothetical protein
MVNDNWKSQGPSYQLPARDVGFRLLGRRFSAAKQAVSIKIFHPAQIFPGSQPVIYSSRSLDLLRPWLDRTSRRCAVCKNVDALQRASTGNKQAR